MGSSTPLRGSPAGGRASPRYAPAVGSLTSPAMGSSSSPDGGARPWGARPCCAAPPQVAALHRATRRPWEARLRRPWGAQRRRPWGARPRRMEEPVHGRARRQTEQRPLAHHYERFLVCVSSTRDLFLPLVVMGTQNGCSVCVCCWRPVWIGKTTVRDAKCIWVTVWVCCWRQPEDSDDDVNPRRMAHNLEPKNFSRRRARGGADPEYQPHLGDT